MEYNGWLVSTNIIKRSLAIVGHYFLGYIIILIAIGIPLAVIIAIAGL